ncbi:hypothetical protein AJ80_08188 [Polytolypa hystricis UAMH7299]|uniref:Mitochondrial escape protein 2 n=1 Tax=Polytolypa hystricis (strain UAMH7299) TaxID=1447883 RepID=A0A2B7X3X8_POLH7|nr:hypothetical protein AJ80_08188 [Polytolypa hystricis UAMH7299]
MIGLYRAPCVTAAQRVPVCFRVGHILRARSPRLLSSRLNTTHAAPVAVRTHADESGHIEAGPNEAIFFIDNVFPLKLLWLRPIAFLNPNSLFIERIRKQINLPSIAAADPLSTVERALPPKIFTQITEIIPRVKEGGAFIKFSHVSGASKAELEHELAKYLKENPIRPWFNPFGSAGAALVRGRPWIEDLYRLPSSRLKVEFLPTSPGGGAAELTQETLYSLTRRYGKLADIVAQPSESKLLPRYAFVDFSRARYAVMARNCLHGYVVSEAEGGGKNGTLLKLTYDQKTKTHWIKDWVFGHPRIVIPIIAALIATITVIIFDPIRTFFIKSRITPPLHLQDNQVWQWVQTQASKANDMLSFRRRGGVETSEMRAIWEDRQRDIQQIRNWLIESTGTFIVVQGPRGSGKQELILDEVLKDRKYTLLIDCTPIQEAQGDSATINAAAAEVGYRPVFSWMNNISSIVDMATQSTFGAKTGFSETLDGQLGKIFQNTANALKQVALDGKNKDEKDAQMSDDEYLEAHPERRPVVVINNFLHKANEGEMLYDKLADWAAAVTYSNIAQVIFLTADVSYQKTLRKPLPNQAFHSVSLRDCPPEAAKRYVLDHIEPNGDSPGLKENEKEYIDGLDRAVEVLGGRLTDLELLARMIRSGEDPEDAIRQIINQSVADILKVFIIDVNSDERHWSAEQAWFFIKQLGEKEENAALRYNEVLLSGLFKSSGETTIQALEQAELISVGTLNGRPSSIKPGRPVYHAAFKRLSEDKVLCSRLDRSTALQLIAAENENIAKYKEELKVWGSLPKQPSETTQRIKWLLNKLVTSQVKIEKWEKESEAAKKVLQSQY